VAFVLSVDNFWYVFFRKSPKGSAAAKSAYARPIRRPDRPGFKNLDGLTCHVLKKSV